MSTKYTHEIKSYQAHMVLIFLDSQRKVQHQHLKDSLK